eukprot:GFUD01026779.1.p1 GENE.GFUD01026779.1~~GFUD01026779.1.p1  ORF type:complete len:479 (+),score=168.82 GFUD01026779.1:64-1437(+)
MSKELKLEEVSKHSMKCEHSESGEGVEGVKDDNGDEIMKPKKCPGYAEENLDHMCGLHDDITINHPTITAVNKDESGEDENKENKTVGSSDISEPLPKMSRETFAGSRNLSFKTAVGNAEDGVFEQNQNDKQQLKANRPKSLLETFNIKFTEGNKGRRHSSWQPATIQEKGNEDQCDGGVQVKSRPVSLGAMDLDERAEHSRLTISDSLFSDEKGKRQRAKEKIRDFFRLHKELFERLMEWRRGIFRTTRVFGSTIPAIAKSDGASVPVFLTNILSQIATNPAYMSTEGLYRQNGNLATIQTLRFDIENGHLAKLEMVKNVHILTGLVKLFFRELKEPLISWSTVEELVSLTEAEGDKVMSKMEIIINKMHQSNRSSLHAVLDHLSTVADLSEENSMTAENLAIVMGPTLTWSEGEVERDTIATILVKQNSVVEFLIKNYPTLKLLKQQRESASTTE